MRGFLSNLGEGLGAVGAGLTDPAGEFERRRKEKQLQQAQQLGAQQSQRLGSILSGQSTPAFLRVGGAEGNTPEQVRQLQLNELAGLGTPEALEILASQSPLTQQAAAPLSPVGKINADIKAGRIDPETGRALIKQAIGGDPGLLERKQRLDEKKFEQDVREFEQKAKTGGLNQKEVFDNTQKLRKEFTGLSGEFIKQRDAFGRIQASIEDPSAAGDLALIFNFMKVLDPGSTVREGEFATAANSAGVPDRIRAQYNKVSTGERLADKQRNDFANRAKKLFSRANTQHNKRVEQFTGVAKRAGFNVEDVLLDLGLAEKTVADENIATGASILEPQQEGEGTIATNPQTGAKLILRGGRWQPL